MQVQIQLNSCVMLQLLQISGPAAVSLSNYTEMQAQNQLGKRHQAYNVLAHRLAVGSKLELPTPASKTQMIDGARQRFGLSTKHVEHPHPS